MQSINKLTFTNLTGETDSSNNDLVLTSTQNFILNPSGTTICTGLSINNNNNSIYNLLSNNGLTGSNNTIESKGNGNIKFLSNTNVNSMTLSDNGIMTFDKLPTSSTNASNTNDFLTLGNLSNFINFVPQMRASSGGSFNYTTQTGEYIRVGDIVMFNAIIIVSSISVTNTGDGVSLTIPIISPYIVNNAPVPQVFTISEMTGYTGNNFDTTLSINGGGTGSNNTNIDFANLFQKTNASSNSTTLKYNNVTTPFKIVYSGTYFVIA
jgi:hypothetical protein